MFALAAPQNAADVHSYCNAASRARRQRLRVLSNSPSKAVAIRTGSMQLGDSSRVLYAASQYPCGNFELERQWAWSSRVFSARRLHSVVHDASWVTLALFRHV